MLPGSKGLTLEEVKPRKHWDTWSSEEDEPDIPIVSSHADAPPAVALDMSGGSATILSGAVQGETLCSRWLADMCTQLSAYEQKLLLRHVPGLPQGQSRLHIPGR